MFDPSVLIEKHLLALNQIWKDLDQEANILEAAQKLGDIINSLERHDLLPNLLAIQVYGPSTGIYCKFLKVFFDYLSENKLEQQIQALKKLAACDIPQELNQDNILCLVVAGANAALAEIYLETELLEFEFVDACLAKAFTWGKCPYTELLLRKIIEKKKLLEPTFTHSALPIIDFSDKFCSQPFTRLATLPPAKQGSNPAVFACSCPGMLPYPINPGDEERSSDDIWNGPEAQEIRRSILDGDFTYCSPMLCPYLVQDSLPRKSEVVDPVYRDIIDNHKLTIENHPTDIMLAHDISCNIACPSCRTSILVEKRTAQEKFDLFMQEKIFPIMTSPQIYLHISGDGDPIGSRHYRKIMHALDPIKYQNVSISLHSNGLLLTEQEWASLSKIHEMIKTVSISIDAARKETYEILRKPGKWDVLSRNMDFLSKLRLSEKLDYLSIQFVVQRDNFKEIPLFIELGKQWGVDKIYFSRLFPTIHQDNVIEGREAYLQNAICEISHPQHTELLEVLRNPSLQEPIVDLFNMSKLVDHV